MSSLVYSRIEYAELLATCANHRGISKASKTVFVQLKTGNYILRSSLFHETLHYYFYILVLFSCSDRHKSMDIHIEQCQSLATTRLCDAALLGNVRLLLDLLEEDPLILERCIIEISGNFRQSPLHVAVAKGHREFVDELLRREPELAEMIDRLKRSTPLHIASSKGHSQIIKALIGEKPNMCFARDHDGRTPIFVAAVNGQIGALELLHQANPYAAQERTNAGETILHLCVKHNKLDSFKRLLELVNDGNQLINFKDSNGNNVLHLAVIGKHSEMVEFLSGYQGLNKNAININKMTAVDINRNQTLSKKSESQNVEQFLKHAKARRAKTVLKHQADGTWLEEQRASLMVVASLIATMAFQVGINPPGGVWQGDKMFWSDNSFGTNHTLFAGAAVWTYNDSYDWLLFSNTAGLISSLTVILLLISGLPFKRHFLLILRITLWIAVTATSFTYYFAARLLDGPQSGGRGWISYTFSLIAWVGVMVFFLFGHFVRFILKLIGWQKRQLLKDFCKRCFPWSTNTFDNSNSTNHV